MCRPALALSLAALLVVAGCSSPVARDPGVGTPSAATVSDDPTATPASSTTRTADDGTPTPTDDPAATDDPATTTADPPDGPSEDADPPDPPDPNVINGSLPESLDPAAVYARVVDVMGADPTAVQRPRIWVGWPLDDGARSGPSPPTGFRKAMALAPPRPGEAANISVGGLTNSIGTVYLLPGSDSTPAETERTLAHEFVHVVQFSQGANQRLARAAPPEYALTTDGQVALRSVLEGGAVYGSDTYTRDHLPAMPTESTVLERGYPRASPGTRLYWGPYYFGSAYVRWRAATPANLSAVYDDPPVTSEQVIHRTTPEREPRANLTVDADVGPVWRIRTRDTMGELFVRIALDRFVARERAVTAGTGWGNDRLLEVRHRNATGTAYAWVLRFDDRANASEFDAVLGDYLANRTNASDPGNRTLRARTDVEDDRIALRTSRVDPTTVVLYVGDRRFVANATTTVTAFGTTVGTPNATADGTAPVFDRTAAPSTPEPGI